MRVKSVKNVKCNILWVGYHIYIVMGIVLTQQGCERDNNSIPPRCQTEREEVITWRIGYRLLFTPKKLIKVGSIVFTIFTKMYIIGHLLLIFFPSPFYYNSFSFLGSSFTVEKQEDEWGLIKQACGAKAPLCP